MTGAPVNSARLEFAHMLRAVAMLSVLVSHLAYTFWLKPGIVAGLIVMPKVEHLTPSASHIIAPDFGLADFWGYFGVGLFFLISGLVIPFSAATLSREGFVVARVFRIWPTYVVGLSITLACISFNAANSGTIFPYTSREVLYHYLILPRWPTLTRPIDGILWTLEVEIFFYALCAVFIDRLRRFDASIFLIALASIPAAFIAGFGMSKLIAIGHNAYPLTHWMSSMLSFVSFMLIGTAFYFHHAGRLSMWDLLAIDIGLLITFSAAWRLGPFAAQGWSGPTSFLIANLLFAAAYASQAILARWPGRLKQVVGRFADISYPLYVVHGVLGYSILAYALGAGVSAPIALGLAVSCAIVIAIVLHVTVERPSHAYGKSLAERLSLCKAPGLS
jgi:peptidoglycan/LPS O-acetylase OafA/YrhL